MKRTFETADTFEFKSAEQRDGFLMDIKSETENGYTHVEWTNGYTEVEWTYLKDMDQPDGYTKVEWTDMLKEAEQDGYLTITMENAMNLGLGPDGYTEVEWTY